MFTEAADFRHDVSDSPCKNLPFLSALVGVGLEQVLVGLERRHDRHLCDDRREVKAHERERDGLVDGIDAGLEPGPFVLDGDRDDGLQGSKRAFSEGQETRVV